MLSLLLIKISLESKRASPKKRARLQSLALSFQEIHLLKVIKAHALRLKSTDGRDHLLSKVKTKCPKMEQNA